MRDYLIDRPRPTSGEELEALLRAILTAERMLSEAEARALEISSDTNDDATVVHQLRLDASGRSIDLAGITETASARLQSHEQRAAPPEPVSRTEVTVEQAAFAAKPVHLGPMPVQATGSAQNVRYAWLEDARGGLWVEHLPAAEGKPASASCDFEFDVNDLEPLAKVLVQQADPRAELVEFVPEITTPTDRSVSAHIQLRCRYGLLRATATVEVDAELDDAMVAHVQRLEIASKNPVIQLALRSLLHQQQRQGKIPEAIAVNDQLPSGIALTDARIRAEGSTITLHADVLAEGE